MQRLTGGWTCDKTLLTEVAKQHGWIANIRFDQNLQVRRWTLEGG